MRVSTRVGAHLWRYERLFHGWQVLPGELAQICEFSNLPVGFILSDGIQLCGFIGYAEQGLIKELSPCFNIALNERPIPLPPEYLPPTAPIKHLRTLKRMLREARFSGKPLKADMEW